MSNKMYDVLKRFGTIILPAMGAFYATLSQIWSLPYGTEIPATLAALAVLVCSVLGVSSELYKKWEGKDNE